MVFTLPSISSQSLDTPASAGAGLCLVEMPLIPIALTRSSTERVDIPCTLRPSPRVGFSFLNDGDGRLPGHAPGYEKARAVGAFAELRHTQLHRPGAGLPVPFAITIALGQP
jgi:hypothetical protein